MGRRAKLGIPLVDQACMAATAFLFTMTAARVSDVGGFAIYVAYQLVVIFFAGLYRSGPASWAVVASGTGNLKNIYGGLCIVAIGLSMIAMPFMAIVMEITGTGIQALTLSTLFVTGYLSLDAGRVTAYKEGRPWKAAMLSACLLSGYAVWMSIAPPTGPVETMGLAASAYLLAGFVGLVFYLPFDVKRGLIGIGAARKSHGGGTIVNYWITSVLRFGTPTVMAGAGGPIALAAFRGAQAVAALPAQIPEGLKLPYLTYGARQYGNTGTLPKHFFAAWSLLQLSVFIPFTLMAIFIPESWGKSLLGETWEHAGPALPWVLLAVLFSQLSMGIELGARVTAKVADVARIRAWTGIAGLLVVFLSTVGLGVTAGLVAFAGVNAATGLILFKTLIYNRKAE